MKKMIIGAVVAAFTFPALPVTGYAQSAKETVAAYFMKGISYFNKHDLPAFLNQFDADINMFTPTGWLRGKREVENRFITTFRQFPKVYMKIDELNVKEVNSNLVLVDFKWTTYPMGAGPAYHGVGSGVYINKAGNWVELMEHETVLKTDEGLLSGKK